MNHERKRKGDFRLSNEEFGKLYVHSRPTQPPFSYSMRSRARNPPLERVLLGAKPRIPDINVKFAFRLSTAPRVFSSPLSSFVTEGETVSFVIPWCDCISSSTRSFLPTLVSFVLYFQISSSNTSPFLLARNFDSSP